MTIPTATKSVQNYCIKINSDLIQNKEKTLERINRDCDSPTILDNRETVYVKKPVRKKHANKFSKPCRLQSVNTEKKPSRDGPARKSAYK
ncbi:unnamed protein product [Acanthoscelides obtectus]|uniref:Uncharacterized protein n=1 Tax=Acanthoscelides obtectus TaxID=200917 RepID=A0A9P0MAV0_ACAOB|nr:unnamed protein product [Acanthoscelides obtectus]CAK1637740.1 hypothetical protein AOBTE_LOCUS10169 [Acanthoscelides obtectus]